MGHRIKQTAYLQPANKPVKNPDYLSWIRQLPCVVTTEMPVEAAHLSVSDDVYGHAGRGKGTKADDCWAVPLSPEQHRKQHETNEMNYWRRQQIDPHIVALALWRIYSTHPEEDESVALATLYINRRCLGRIY